MLAQAAALAQDAAQLRVKVEALQAAAMASGERCVCVDGWSDCIRYLLASFHGLVYVC